MEFSDAINKTRTIQCDFQITVGRQTELPLMTNSLSLFEISRKPTMTTEKRIMIDLQMIK